MARIVDPARIAEGFREEIRREVAALPEPLRVVGFLSADHGPSVTYAEYTKKGCEDVGVQFDLRHVSRLSMEGALREANGDPSVHGILVYYPVFGTEQDVYLREAVDPRKDLEGLHSLWAHCLYENKRFVGEDGKRKAILPCTPLAILKLLDAAGASTGEAPRPYRGRRVCIFNRSEVVGRPLASMLSNDGAEVWSFDVDGPLFFAPAPDGGAHSVHETNIDRSEALAQADIVITGVPSKEFPLIQPSEIREGAICLNFSTRRNFAENITDKASVFVPRVGPMTVTMAIRNVLRLYRDAKV